MKGYLVVVEGGKNNIGGCALHIVRRCELVHANGPGEAIVKAIKNGQTFISHFGGPSDYVTAIDIKEMPEEPAPRRRF